MARKQTILAFDAWVKDEANVEELFRLIVEERVRLRDACIERLKVPYTLMYAFLHSTPQLKGRYEAALAAVAEELAQETLAIADEQKEVEREDGTTFDPDVNRDRLRVETRKWVAEKWNKDRYGETLRVERSSPPGADAGLIGTMGALLALVASGQRPMRIVGEASDAAEVLPPAEVAPARLPAAPVDDSV